jgi:WD40 repeat protein
MVAVVNPGMLFGLRLPEMEPLWQSPIELSDWRAGAVGLSPDSEWVAIGTEQDGMRIWEVESGKELTLPNNTKGRPTIATFSHDSRYLAVGDDHGGVYVWQMPESSDQPALRHGIVMWHDLSIASLRFNKADQLAVATNQSVRVWRLQDNEPLSPSIPVDSQIRRVDWTADGKISIQIRTATSHQFVGMENFESGTDSVNQLANSTIPQFPISFDPIATSPWLQTVIPFRSTDATATEFGSTTVIQNTIREQSNISQSAGTTNGWLPAAAMEVRCFGT